MDHYIVGLVIVGLAVLGAVGLPRLLANQPLSLPIIFVGFGWLVFTLPLGFEAPNPLEYELLSEKLTELIVIIALMGAGLKLDRRPTFRNWSTALRLLVITMPLCIALVAGLGIWVAGLSMTSAILLGAVLAPTDPVLASDVQVGPPQEGNEDETRFSLTLEAGLNDGLAFPFTYLAIAIALAGASSTDWFGHWFLFDLVYRVTVGFIAGVVIGRLIAWLVFHLPARTSLAETGEGLAALAITLVAYGVTEMVEGYGFLAVFVAAHTLRRFEHSHKYHVQLHEFSESLERLLLAILLVLFGGALASGLLESLTWQAALVGLLLIFFIRPAAGLLGLVGAGLSRGERLAISFFGIRGIGSFYYLAYAVNQAAFPDARQLWALVGFVVLVSIIVHGVTASSVMSYLDQHGSSVDEPAETIR